MQNILTGFLRANLLPIGEDDEKLKFLEAAALELAKRIKATPIIAHRFALVGLDERVSVSDPVHEAAGQAVIDKWQTMTNKTGPNPIQVYRAVILRSLEIAATDSRNIASALLLVS